MRTNLNKPNGDILGCQTAQHRDLVICSHQIKFGEDLASMKGRGKNLGDVGQGSDHGLLFCSKPSNLHMDANRQEFFFSELTTWNGDAQLLEKG